jgi:gas vesicle protein
VKARAIVQEKVDAGLPITEQERELLGWRGGRIRKEDQANRVMAAAASLLIKPQSVTELRVLVEKTAAKHSYNPIEELILQTRSEEMPEKEKAAIHKALLPFLVPQLAAPKQERGDGEGGGVKVTVTQFVFPDKNPKTNAPLHTEKPATVDTTSEKAP